MTTAKKLGIWMDHSSAHLIEFTMDPAEATIVDSDFSHQDKTETLGKSENIMHNKEQQKQSEYYKKLADIIRNYDHVILFGPTDAKSELYNLIKDDHHFSKVAIVVRQTDKMTPKEEEIFVRNHFETHQI